MNRIDARLASDLVKIKNQVCRWSEWSVYIVKTSKGYLYTGISTDPNRRVEEHNSSKRGAKCLRGQRPVKLVCSIPFATKSQALKLEAKIKKMSHNDKVFFINDTNLIVRIP